MAAPAVLESFDQDTSESVAEQEAERDASSDGPPSASATPEIKGQYVATRYADQNPHYTGLYRQWEKPLYFLVGKHWLKWDERQNVHLLDTDVPEWRQQPVTNLTYAIYRTALAKLTKQRPTLEVIPPSGDSEDRDSANLGQSILQFLWRYLKTPQKVIRALGWLLATGNVAFDVDWDPEAGETKPRTVLVEVNDPDDVSGLNTIDAPCACDEEGEPHRRKPTNELDRAVDGGDPYDLEREPDDEPAGEISLNIDDPLSYRFNPEATSPEDATEWYIAKLIPRHEVAAQYNISEDDLMSSGGDDGGEERSRFDDSMSAVVAGAPDPFMTKTESVGSSTEGAERHGKDVLVIKYYRKPCAAEGYPKGRHWIVAGGKQIWPAQGDAEFPKGESELPHGFWPPRVALVDTPVPGQPHGLGMLGQVVPLNEQLNHHDGKIGEYHTTQAMGGVTWVTPEDRAIQITSEPGQVKVSKGYQKHNKPPVREKLEALPAPVYNEREVIMSKIRMVAGMSELDLGQRPEGVSAGRAFLVLQEASDAPLMLTLMAIEEALCEVGRRQLVLAQRFYTEERTIKIAGEKGHWQFISFTGADLKDGLDVRVQVGSSFPWSKSAQWDSKLSLIQALPQLVLKPDGSLDREELSRLLDSGPSGLSGFESSEDPDLVEIDREHAMYEAYNPESPDGSNQLPQLAVWQNQPKHQEYHYQFMKREYSRFKRWHPAAQLAFMEHLRLTTEAVAQIVNSLTQPPPGAGNNGAGPADTGGSPPPGAPAGPMRLVPPGGTEGKKQTPGANKKAPPLAITKGDRAAAGQA